MEKTNKPMTAGVLDIISGVLSFLWAISLFIGFAITSEAWTVSGGIGYIPNFVPGLILVWAIVSIIITAINLVGGIYAIKRKQWGWALAGSILAIIAFLPLGIASTILVAQAKDEFE
ncbi:hypothetical protein ACFLVM_01415 [Chloroflexota bacterium]